MATKITVKMPSGEGIAAGSTATFRIPVGLRFHALYFLFNYNAGTLNLSHFTEIRLFINGVVFQRFSATERDTLNQFDYFPAATNGVLTMSFDRVALLQAIEAERTAINTGVPDEAGRLINSMYMEVDIAAGATVAPSDLSLYAKQSDAVGGGPGVIPYIRREVRTAAGADNDFQISDLVNPGVNAPDKIALARATFVPSANTINTLQIDRNNYKIFERPDGLNRAIQQNGVRNPQAGYYTIDTAENAQGTDVIQLFNMTDYRYRFGVSGAMQITCISEYFGVLTGN